MAVGNEEKEGEMTDTGGAADGGGRAGAYNDRVTERSGLTGRYGTNVQSNGDKLLR